MVKTATIEKEIARLISELADSHQYGEPGATESARESLKEAIRFLTFKVERRDRIKMVVLSAFVGAVTAICTPIAIQAIKQLMAGN